MKTGTESKLKFKKLQRRLKLPLWQAVGLLETLWRVTERNAPAGDIGRLSNEDIAAAIEWDGDADELVATLVATGWLDEDVEHRLIIHDWSEHAPTWLKGNFAKHEKTFADQSAKQRRMQPAKQPAKQCATSPVQSSPYQTSPVQSTQQAASDETDLRKTFDGLDKRTKQAALAVAERIQTVVPMARGSPAVDWAIGVGLRVATGDLSRDRIERIVEAMRGKEIKRPQKYFMKALENGDA